MAWFTECRCGRISTIDIDKTHDIVFNDRRLKVREIDETVWHILHECLGMRKLSARWMPRLVTADHKWARVIASEQCLGMFQCNSKGILLSLCNC